MLFGVGSLLALTAASVVVAVAIVGHIDLNSLVFAGISALFAMSFILGFTAWLLGLMKTARISRWDWFVAVLILGMPGALIYGISGPSGRSYLLTSATHRYANASTH